ncbi:hypothetical protein [uncultured Desulfobulbus sp.]|uniref:hypothetical protein n=1 Tax=uncultured Desulfobulbus sp. TaxID=239745 RepID=UPI0029C82026|nr:hypothetical protein [uncultured Desulfobulbus sp.]
MAEPLDAAWIGLAGVVVGLLSAHFGEWRRWRRDRVERKLARELELKRELYLPLVGAFTEASALIVAVPQTAPDKLSSLTLSQEAQRALSAKDLIANKEVIISVGAAAKQLALGLSRLMVTKVEEVTLATDLQYLAQSIEQLNAENMQINRHMESLLAQGEDRKSFAIYNQRFRLNQDRLEELFPEQDRKQNLKNQVLQRLQKDSVKELIDLVAKTAHAIVAIRNDLQLPDETDAILDYYRESTKEIGVLFPEIVDQIWNVANKAIADDKKKG